MARNLGDADKVIRIVLGWILVSMVFVGPKTYLGLIGVTLVVTALFSFCPLYRIVGIRTCKQHKSEDVTHRQVSAEQV